MSAKRLLVACSALAFVLGAAAPTLAMSDMHHGMMMHHGMTKPMHHHGMIMRSMRRHHGMMKPMHHHMMMKGHMMRGHMMHKKMM